jgi:predicted amidohydrolase
MTEMRVACVQLEAHDLVMAEQSLEQALSMIDRASQGGPELIVLPECTYPAYYVRSLEAYEEAELRPYDEVLGLFGERARRHRAHLVVGIARRQESGRLLNEACLFDPERALLGRYAKCFL